MAVCSGVPVRRKEEDADRGTQGKLAGRINKLGMAV
jgi:hypothetical protein